MISIERFIEIGKAMLSAHTEEELKALYFLTYWFCFKYKIELTEDVARKRISGLSEK